MERMEPWWAALPLMEMSLCQDHSPSMLAVSGFNASVRIKQIKIANVKVQTINVMLLHVVFDCLCGMEKCEVFGRESSYGACSVLTVCCVFL